jgi:salicylate hydroxylase
MGLTSQQPRIAILGAGIGGLALAIGLTRQNVPYTIYEADPDFSAIGAGIALGPNSVRAINLIDPELKALYDKISNGNKSPEKKHVFADFLLAEPGFGINQGWEAKPVWSKEFEKSGAHRQDLLDIMTKLISTSNVKFNKRAVDVEQVKGKVFITFADSEKIEADAVIGCDGGKGVSRKAVLGAEYSQHVAATYSGRYVYRSIVPAKESKETLGDYANDGKMFFGPGLYFSVYQLPGGKSNLVAARQNGNPWNHAQWTHEVTREEMIADFEGCDARLMKLLEVSDIDFTISSLTNTYSGRNPYAGHYSII